ncbi:hypothetical protein [Allocoleopsis sp.]|uniref:hypothetical protein n=1 Tax=Allocoleopsis sp. TaxID=3088169 RepID=UPI002FD65748
MTGQEALTFVDTFLRSANHSKRLNDIQSEVFLQTWAGLSYKEIAQQLGYQHDYIKQVGSQLWRSLSQTFGEPVSKRNVKAVLRHYQQSQTNRGESLCLPFTQDWSEAIDLSRFYGRKEELQTLETWILEDGCRVIAPRTALGAIRLLDLVG